ncbi:MAG: phage portal protein [Deltaproteobacteria bacterium]|nr:phage portal protein [Deltaproteobacteria bacterium]
MGIVSRMARPKALTPQELERMILTGFGGSSTSSGVLVSSETAMRQATVYSCVNALSRVIGTLPCHLMETDGVNRTKLIDDPLYFMLHDQPNEWQTTPEFWGMCINHLVLRGNFFILKNRGMSLTGPVKELIPLAPGIVQEVKQDKQFRLLYKVRYPDGTQTEIPQSQIMHIRGMTVNGFMGVNPIQYIRESIALGLASEEFGARYFGSGTHPGIIVEHPGKISPEAKSNLASSLTEAYSGLGKSHRLMLLQENMKAKPITINPKDSQFLELRKYQKAEIVDIFFGMPLTILSSEDKTPTYASAEQFSIGFVIYALMPWLVTIEKAISRDLIPMAKRKTQYAKFTAQGLQRGSFKEQMDSFAVAIDKEIMNPNEARMYLDLNPYEGGDEYRTRTSTVKEDKKLDEKSK